MSSSIVCLWEIEHSVIREDVIRSIWKVCKWLMPLPRVLIYYSLQYGLLALLDSQFPRSWFRFRWQNDRRRTEKGLIWYMRVGSLQISGVHQGSRRQHITGSDCGRKLAIIGSRVSETLWTDGRVVRGRYFHCTLRLSTEGL